MCYSACVCQKGAWSGNKFSDGWGGYTPSEPSISTVCCLLHKSANVACTLRTHPRVIVSHPKGIVSQFGMNAHVPCAVIVFVDVSQDSGPPTF